MKIEGIEIPTLGGGIDVTLSGHLEQNAPADIMQIMKRRESMRRKNLEELNDRLNTHQSCIETG